MITYTNYTNLDSHYDRPYEPGDRLVRGYEGVLCNMDDALFYLAAEVVFDRHNRDDRPDGQLCPSMSVGDVVVFGEVALSVDRMGFVFVTVDAADIFTDATWVEMMR